MSGPPKTPFRHTLSPEFLTELFRDSLDAGYADAASRREGEAAGSGGGTTPWRRRWPRALSLLVLVVVGLLFATAYRQVLAEEPERQRVRDELVGRIQEREDENGALRERAEELRGEVTALRDRLLADRHARELRTLEARTGLAGVTGDGVVVRVADGPPGVDPVTGAPEVDPLTRVLDVDLRQITNALWAAGAEAVAINDHRLTATSTIRKVASAILVNYVPVSSPYLVTAIGPDDLADRFAESLAAARMRGLAAEYGISYDLRAESDLTLPAASAPRLRHAEPTGGD